MILPAGEQFMNIQDTGILITTHIFYTKIPEKAELLMSGSMRLFQHTIPKGDNPCRV